MPCFKGLAVSIHTPDGPLPEFSVMKQSRQSRVTSYIPVPSPKLSADGKESEPSIFSISITLLMPGQPVPYSRPKPTPDDPFPPGRLVGALPGTLGERGSYGVVGPYIPLTMSPNETVAAYIHFDGRAKEEVATLLRPREETWVNSRWVSVPESEGGGLAERDFMFREVGLERWLNGLDLKGDSQEIAARVQKRRERLEKKRRKRAEQRKSSDDDGSEMDTTFAKLKENGVLRYGEDSQAPVESLSMDEDGMFDSDSDSEDEMPAEAAGQIKVSLFRVLASGEIKKGEYSPQFDAHDDDETGEQGNGDADVDHTTTFAKPKTLDPKSISTQTVTGIDPTDRPYATFTFFYRSRKSLQKMGVIPTTEHKETKPTTSKRKSRGQVDFSSLGPLKAKGTVGFAGYREARAHANGVDGKIKYEDDMESDGEEDDKARKKSTVKEEEDDDGQNLNLTQEEITKRGELADGVKKIQLKRQHSHEPVASSAKNQSSSTKPSTPPEHSVDDLKSADQTSASTGFAPAISAPEGLDALGSPFKRQRASITDPDTIPKRGLFTGAVPAASKLASEELKKDIDGASTKDAAATTTTPAIKIEEHEMDDTEL